jgi:hypothetical protein
MNPRTIRWQALVLAPLLMAVALLVAPISALAIAVAAFMAALALNAGYAQALGDLGRPTRRMKGDLWVARFIGIALALPAVASAVLLLADHNADERLWEFDLTQTAVLVISPAVLFTLMLLSSLVDWYYIRPRIDGVVWAPPVPHIWQRYVEAPHASLVPPPRPRNRGIHRLRAGRCPRRNDHAGRQASRRRWRNRRGGRHREPPPDLRG